MTGGYLWGAIGGGVVGVVAIVYIAFLVISRVSKQAGAGEVKVDMNEKAIEVTNRMNKKILESHSTEDTEEDLRKGEF